MKSAIVAIGGGLIRTKGTEAIDREIIRVSGRRHPHVLFIPTASSDSEEYWQRFDAYFGGFLKCRTDVLRLVTAPPPKAHIERKILSADVVYVGGGNTLFMMRLWRRLGVDEILRKAYRRGIVLSGISAGAICWFDSGHSDSMSFYDAHHWKYINVGGLGLPRGVLCPHYDSTTQNAPRRSEFRKMIRRIGGVGIALENNCAIEIIDGRLYRVIRSKPNAHAYRLRKRNGAVQAGQIRPQSGFTPIDPLYESA